ncbi:MAG: BadF/BadG/BcrA/BcrD ATPase family protein [Thermodesulfobacteriota bacterium]
MLAGVDLGSRAVKVAVLEDGVLVAHHIVESGFDPTGQAAALLAAYRPERVVATGYGRHLAQRQFAQAMITISMKSRGAAAADIARAVHLAVAGRIMAMVNRLGCGQHVVFSGGVARNPCMLALLQERLPAARLEVAPVPDLLGALGAALHGERLWAG